jgi:hypothetical protein
MRTQRRQASRRRLAPWEVADPAPTTPLRPVLVDVQAEGIGPGKHALAALRPGEQVQLVVRHGQGRVPFWVRLTRVPCQPNPIHPPAAPAVEPTDDYEGLGEPDAFWAEFRGQPIVFSRANIAEIA